VIFEEGKGVIAHTNGRPGEVYETLIGEDGHWSVRVGRCLKLVQKILRGRATAGVIVSVVSTQDDGLCWITIWSQGD
jgi:hypothetical protein